MVVEVVTAGVGDLTVKVREAVNFFFLSFLTQDFVILLWDLDIKFWFLKLPFTYENVRAAIFSLTFLVSRSSSHGHDQWCDTSIHHSIRQNQLIC